MPSWSPGGDFGSPTYSLPIQVVDGVRSTFIGERRKRWTTARNRALAAWELPFEVSQRPESEQPYVADDETISTLGVNPLVIAGKIALVRSHSPGIGDAAAWIQEMGGGVALVTPWRAWWQETGQSLIMNMVGHEVGHTLGFGHGGTGVMLGALRPNEEERTLAAEYYGVA